ncbi:MAG: dienelactone hydrolase family protein [Verrucomicrobia bacterium]|nr:dienelactone hydrolase family protein [Verrucomicrobiota bacterium]
MKISEGLLSIETKVLALTSMAPVNIESKCSDLGRESVVKLNKSTPRETHPDTKPIMKSLLYHTANYSIESSFQETEIKCSTDREIIEEVSTTSRSWLQSESYTSRAFGVGVFLILLLICSSFLSAQNNSRNKGSGLSEIELAIFEERNFHGMPYRLLLPIDFDPRKTYPLILNLHGRAGIGDDNKSQLRSWSKVFTTKAWRKKFRCIMIAPQSWDSWSAFNEMNPELSEEDISQLSPAWQERFKAGRYSSDEVSTGSLTMAFLLVDQIVRDYKADPKRIYVLGHSMGGFGTWNAIWADPGRFAAAIPSAGGLLPWKNRSRFLNVPIWAFHGTDDPTVSFTYTQEIFDALKSVKGNMKFTALGGVKHNASTYGFVYEGDDEEKGFITHTSSKRCDKTPNVWDWLFKQKLD